MANSRQFEGQESLLPCNMVGEQKATQLLDLPNEIVLKVLSYLPCGVLHKKVALVCKRFLHLTRDPSLCLELQFPKGYLNTEVAESVISRASMLQRLALPLHRSWGSACICQQVVEAAVRSGAKLKELVIGRCPHNDATLEIVTASLVLNHSLTTITLGGDTYWSRHDVNIKPLAKLTNLQHLYLRAGIRSSAGIIDITKECKQENANVHSQLSNMLVHAMDI